MGASYQAVGWNRQKKIYDWLLFGFCVLYLSIFIVLTTIFNPNYTFETFVEGDCNRLARSAGFAVANKPGGTSFNPLVVHGGVGLGKTHLLHSIAREILKVS